MKKCPLCGGKVSIRNIDLSHQWGDQWYIFHNVPAHVCEECGEEYLDADTLKKIDRLREIADKSSKRMEVGTADFSEANRAA